MTVDPHLPEAWKSIPNHLIEKFGDLNFLLHCNYDNKVLAKSGLPPFHRQILMNFRELKTLYRPNYLSDLLLFNNEEIKIDGNSIFYLNWSEKAVLSIKDFLDCNGKFLSFQTFQQRYNMKCNFLNFLQVLSAIPKYLLEKARTAPPIDKHNFLGSTSYKLSDSIVIDLTKMNCKDYYWLYGNATKIEPTGQKKWPKDLNLDNFN